LRRHHLLLDAGPEVGFPGQEPVGVFARINLDDGQAAMLLFLVGAVEDVVADPGPKYLPRMPELPVVVLGDFAAQGLEAIRGLDLGNDRVGIVPAVR
jgi:hypothetical protein